MIRAAFADQDTIGCIRESANTADKKQHGCPLFKTGISDMLRTPDIDVGLLFLLSGLKMHTGSAVVDLITWLNNVKANGGIQHITLYPLQGKIRWPLLWKVQ